MTRPRRNDSLEELITRAIRCELAVRDLYSQFARFFSDVPVAAAFWQALSEDESSHAKLLQDARCSLSEAELRHRAEPDVWQALLQVERLLEEDLTSRIRTLSDAYELAHQIEDSELNAIFRLLVVEPIKEPQRRAFLFAQLSEHIERLTALGHAFGPNVRRAVARNRPARRAAPMA